MPAFRYIQYLTATRLANSVKCAFNYALSSFGIYRFTHYPTFVSVEPANYCMLRCPQCPVGINGSLDRKTLDMSMFELTLDQTASHAHTMIFYFQGEPLINNRLAKMIGLAHKRRLYTILSTNGLLMTSQLAHDLACSGLDRVIVSIDGMSQESYETYRQGGKVEDAINAVRLLAQAKKRVIDCRLTIEVQCLMLKSNEHEWAKMKKEYKHWGGDTITFKTAQFYDFESGNPLMPSDQHFSRYRQNEDGTYSRKKPYRNRCFRLWSGAVVDVEGNVLPCCFDKNRNYTFGDIKNDFAQAWNSSEATRFRRQVLSNRQSVDICLNCSE